jgi:hypothetical protein
VRLLVPAGKPRFARHPIDDVAWSPEHEWGVSVIGSAPELYFLVRLATGNFPEQIHSQFRHFKQG